MQRQGLISVTSQCGRIDFFVGKGAARQLRIAPQMSLPQIDAPAMHRHRRRVGKSGPMFRCQFEAAVFSLGTAAVCLEKQSDRSESVAVLVSEVGAQFEKECQTLDR